MNDELSQGLITWVNKGAAPGGVIATFAANKLESFSYGHFSDAPSPAVTMGTVYDVASITKLFTTAIVLRLHEHKQLSIFDPCSLFLPNFHSSDIRIVDLLTHHLDCDVALSTLAKEAADKKELHQRLINLKPPLRPSNKVMYANIQFFYLGVIIERVTGKNIRDAMDELIESVGLPSTYTAPDVLERNIPTPPTEHVANPLQAIPQDESTRMLGGITGHAGIFSTANDLATFGHAWLSGKIVPRSLLDEVVFKNYDRLDTDPQALGWWLRVKTPEDTTISTPGVYSHNGFPGILLAISPTTGKAASFVCNRTYYGRENSTHRHIWQQLIGWVSS